MLGRFLCGLPHEADFRAFRHFANRAGLFLDIGANSGESVLSFRLFNSRAPILSIEPNPYHVPDLEYLKERIDGFDYLLCAAGERNDRETLFVPVYRDLPLTGEASFHREQAIGNYWMQEQVGADAGGMIRLVEVPVDVRRMDDLSLRPAFVKIDVQGSESRVVEGLRATLASSQPILLLERSGCDEVLVATLLELGYRAFVYLPLADRFVPYESQAVQNLFFFPLKDAELAHAS